MYTVEEEDEVGGRNEENTVRRESGELLELVLDCLGMGSRHSYLALGLGVGMEFLGAILAWELIIARWS